MREIIKELNEIKFKNLENEKSGELFSSLFAKKQFDNVLWKNIFCSLLSTLFFQTIEYKDNNSKICFIYTNSCNVRNDYLDDMNKVYNCIDNPSVLDVQKKFSFSNFKNLKYLKNVLIWYHEMKNVSLNNKFKMFMAVNLLRSFILKEKINKLIKLSYISNIKICVSFCDVWIESYLYISALRKLGILTVTLQHAVFSYKDQWWAYLYSQSDYFLGISEWAKGEAIKSGYKNGKFIVVGPMKYIDFQVNTRQKKKFTNVIGIALSSPMYEEDNEDLLKFANCISDRFSCKIKIKSHPAIDLKKYMNSKEIESFEESKMNISEFSHECDFVIMGRTNAFADVISLGEVAFRYTKYGDICDQEKHLKFNNSEELMQLVQEFYNNYNTFFDNIKEIKNYFCPSGDIKENYKKFFESIE